MEGANNGRGWMRFIGGLVVDRLGRPMVGALLTNYFLSSSYLGSFRSLAA